MLKQLAKYPDVFRIHDNRSTASSNYRTSITTGADVVHDYLGYTGDGIGVAIIDSGVASWHDDLTRGGVTKTFPYGDQRVAKFVDFVGTKTTPYDDNGHGTHVAGIIAGNGYDSNGEKAGIAPKASIISLKVLDQNGQGTIGNIIAALNWVVANREDLQHPRREHVGRREHQRVVSDRPADARHEESDRPRHHRRRRRRATRGTNALGLKQYGGIMAPGNAPWVLTVGASSTMGTLTRSDDTLASFSSRGPTAKDFIAKPDLVAPGTGTISLAAPGSLFYNTKLTSLLRGKLSAGRRSRISA